MSWQDEFQEGGQCNYHEHAAQQSRSLAATRSITRAMAGAPADDRVIVLLEMRGGPDGLAMFQPLAQKDTLVQLRPRLGREEARVLDANAGDARQIGLHEGWDASFRALYDAGQVGIYLDTQYSEHASKSHFAGIDMFDAQGYKGQGFAARPLQGQESSDPLGLELGRPALPVRWTGNDPVAIVADAADPRGFGALVDRVGIRAPLEFPDSAHGRLLQKIVETQASGTRYGEAIRRAYDRGRNLASYPGTRQRGGFPVQLATIARLLSGGIGTRIFSAGLTGFDTHGDQGRRMGGQLQEFIGAVAAFMKDLELLGLQDRVLLVTITEFGRTVTENQSNGTDHGTSVPMLVFGHNVVGGIHNDSPDLSKLTPAGTNLSQFSLYSQSVLGSVMRDWMGLEGDALSACGFDRWLRPDIRVS